MDTSTIRLISAALVVIFGIVIFLRRRNTKTE